MSNKINYIPVYKKSSDPTSVWYHFLKADTSDSAKCKTCEKVIKCAGGTTTGLRSHLRLHNISLDSERLASEVARETAGTSKRKNDNSLLESPVSAKNCRMTDYFSQSNRSLDVMVSRMTALDGMPYRAFTESEDLKHLFKKAGYKLPTSANTIKDVTIKFYDKTKKNLIKEIQELKDEGHKFSVSIDEWTSSRNRRYMNVNLHCAFFKGNHHTTRNLGLCRTYGSVTAIKCEEYLRERLHEFKLDFDTDVIAIISDGASVMTKLGGNLNCIHQLCLAHGLQLAIVDTFYVKNQENVNEAQEELAENENNLNTVCIGTEDDTETGGFQIEQAPTVTVDVETNIKFGLVVEKELHASLSKRIKQRRQPVASLMQYLHNPATYFEENEYDADVYPRLPNDCLQEMVLGLLKYDSAAQSFTCNDVNDLPTDDSQNEVGSNSSLSNKELINQQISKIIFDDTRRVGIGNLSTSKEDLLTLLKVEMLLFENGGDRGQLLSKAYRWIRSIKPTSVESERAFSAAGILCNKLRTSLSDKTINCLSFLRTYFQQQKNCK
ncbi:unnamed protein product [Parnassius apollo]|uniref:(apollo) hypothetical protein n=1 Tax=Parnassius apollo TaxID=110799 RepID=A0A8S3W723_PARAO|nr:unnamed protein product [Parnassius apollo]